MTFVNTLVELFVKTLNVCVMKGFRYHLMAILAIHLKVTVKFLIHGPPSVGVFCECMKLEQPIIIIIVIILAGEVRS